MLPPLEFVKRGYKSTSVAERLGALFFLSNSTVLFLSFLSFLLVLVVSSFSSFLQEVDSVTSVLASNSRAALAFQDRDAAERVLSSIGVRGIVKSARLVNSKGELIAQFGEPPVGTTRSNSELKRRSWTLFSLGTAEPVILENEKIGLIVTTTSLTPLYKQLATMMLVGVILAILVAWAASRFFKLIQSLVVTPLRDLQILAQTVSVTKDFTQRLESTRDDEINELIKAFNHMLKQLEERDKCILIAKERAESADRAKSLFLASVSHEFRTPLHAILGMTSEALSTPVSSEQRDLLDTVKTAAESLLSLINDILDISKIEAGKLVLVPAPFNLREFLDKTVKVFQHIYKKKGIALAYTIHPLVNDWVVADAGRLSQILVNLLGNAAKFTPENGSVTLTVENRAPQAGVPASGRLQLRWVVTDTGIGIPEDQIGKIFDSFSQVERTGRSSEGTGLGLAIVAKLVRIMGGWITVESIVNKGSTFSFVIDVERCNEKQIAEYQNKRLSTGATTPDSPIVAQSAKSQTVLVVEDNIVNMKLARRMLERSGYEVLSAENGAVCLELIQKRSVDLILMDINMPVMDGLEATRRIRQMEQGTDTHTPIVALTASINPEDSAMCLESGMDEILFKPIAQAALIATVKSILQQQGTTSTESESNSPTKH